ncbi:hypothetical protein QBC38DRAFT_492184 [Podospora fimiseda]|uniref:Uncharacterized protein n=1 Tax=Podospora fimiseda TaxID=252190 RepID=A0AAN7BGH9_9PEZI|nr:hypothetical protein QBC38DRAFT_492184 [Podospora fimiseda]
MTELVWAVVLSRFIALTDVVFGYLTGGRDVLVPGIEEIAGPTVHMMVSRVKLDLSRSVVESLKGVKEDTLREWDIVVLWLGRLNISLGWSLEDCLGLQCRREYAALMLPRLLSRLSERENGCFIAH